jgi:hypothetical protein
MADKKKEEKELKDIFDNKRSFTMDGEKYYIDNADIDSVRQADWHYSKTYNEALLAGVTTMAQMQDILEERGITGKAWEAKRLELAKALDEKIAELTAAKELSEKKRLAEEVEDLRNKLFRHNQRQSSPASQTCEQLAEDARIEYLTAAMVKDAEGERVWDSYEDYKTTDKPGLAYRSRYEVMLAVQGLASNFLDLTPEAIAKREVEEEETKLLGSSLPEEEKPKKKK